MISLICLLPAVSCSNSMIACRFSSVKLCNKKCLLKLLSRNKVIPPSFSFLSSGYPSCNLCFIFFFRQKSFDFFLCDIKKMFSFLFDQMDNTWCQQKKKATGSGGHFFYPGKKKKILIKNKVVNKIRKKPYMASCFFLPW